MKIAVVGAGPAGLICAWQLSQNGHTVNLFERKSKLGAQGSGVLIQPVGLQVLAQLGILEEIEGLGQRVNFIRGYVDENQRRQIISADYQILNGDFNYALGVNRSVIWSVLYERAVELNININTGVSIKSLSYTRDDDDQSVEKVALVDQEQNSWSGYDLVIDASGANSMLRDYAKKTTKGCILQYGSLWTQCVLPEHSPYNSDSMMIYSGDRNHGVGIMPTGKLSADGPKTVTLFFNMDCTKFADWNSISFEQWKANVVKHWPRLEHLVDQIMSMNQLYLAKFRHQTLPTPYGKKIVFIGDAAHCSSPQLGQGINMSLIDAITLSNSLSSSQDVNSAIKSYSRARYIHVKIYQTLARTLTPFYQSDNKLAIFTRDYFISLFTKLFTFKFLTTLLLSGRVGFPLKTVSEEMQAKSN